MWYFDSGCLCYMTENKRTMSSLQHLQGGSISFGDKSAGIIIGVRTVNINDHVQISNVNLVSSLGFNLLSISQLCDQDKNEVKFTSSNCFVINDKGMVILKGKRFENIYVVDSSFIPEEKLCLSTFKDVSSLWHKKLGHASMNLIHKLQEKELVRGLLQINKERTELCSHCVLRKQVRNSFKSKNRVFTSKPLDLIHMDVCGPMRV